MYSKKVIKVQTQEVTLTKEEFDNILREALGLEGVIKLRLLEEGDYDFGTHKVTGVHIWTEKVL